MVKIFCN